MFAKQTRFLAFTIVSLVPVLAQAQQADSALTHIRQNKAVTIGFRERAAPFCLARMSSGKPPAIPSTSANA
jgi:hypothetical protein